MLRGSSPPARLPARLLPPHARLVRLLCALLMCRVSAQCVRSLTVGVTVCRRFVDVDTGHELAPHDGMEVCILPVLTPETTPPLLLFIVADVLC